jgi:hypothetical protein
VEDKVIVLNNLTIADVEKWEFIGLTPSSRKWYYNKALDVCAYISGGSSLKICYDRKNNRSNAGSSFNKCLVPFKLTKE